ncbi:DUF4145 domain-containing protein [Mesorhizobium sp. M2C.T.Ca.TU.002.02.1.1]|uniref:DUF4145 domain-containing protein n=1 Tax=Mesorhizobium sp. M2C.T.Ca.TU.002.02.1.1 TaxID=2496788 RepID=UPI000FCB62D3|nr:DUF4145 domain-containing protein [Mesorhizobium sp. M2C.T.Ca.TU.002.02.1.1]RUU59446.1 DUF4145 domain-containing protein [Mesorhizobium sp. M2C.T.Ca.TU.002.02.1.1]RUU71592.1 DUF4145 domain-containing protein [Mesorhizobium sp. M2C.T.Ca.TU.009.01.2.1]
MTAPQANENEIRKAECGRCGGIRNCDVRGHHTEHGGDDNYDWYKEWYLLQCRGCEHVFVQTVSTNSEDYYHIEGPEGYETEHIESLSYWPALSKRKKPEWMSDAGIDAEGVLALDEALIELYGALNNDLHMLAAIGIRTAFDVASELLGIDPELGFKAKLKELVSAGHIGKVDAGRLDDLVDAGSASAHRGWRPKADDLNTMADVLEQFVFDAFVAPARKQRLNVKMAEMKRKVPARKAARKVAEPAPEIPAATG